MRYAIYNGLVLEIRTDSSSELPIGGKYVNDLQLEQFNNATTKEEVNILFDSIQ